MFRKILIANRGEIALRVMRACGEMDIRTVAVYSEVDRKALHVRYSDEAFAIGPAPSTDSYLRIDRVLDAARASGADAVHPGYGFLSENPAFARAVTDAGITFIGPSPEAMELLGSKTAARSLVAAAGLPVVPGTGQNPESLEEVRRAVENIGFPVMLKAAAGGGGKGIRLVRSAGQLESAWRDARSEAQNAFGDGTVYVEKLIEQPRHVEIQVLGDRHGNLVYLGERECSLQRRHQKVMEECPSPAVDEALRRRMGESAVHIAKLAGYYNAGTVEFLLDADRNFYFLEVNARLQVEHPVTELVTGIDLVKEQIRVAAGESLGLRQEDVQMRGVAIECRISAEDPAREFFPSPGLITALHVPTGPGVRDDGGVYEGWRVPLEYDPLMAKLIVWGRDRQEAIARLRRALTEYEVAGVETTIPFFLRVLRNPDFLAGWLDTGLVGRILSQGAAAESVEANSNDGAKTVQHQTGGASAPDPAHAARLVAALAASLEVSGNGASEAHPARLLGASQGSRWKTEGRETLLRQWPRGRR
ncbi:MAG TPA: acetyl-CoA carboxylase biotin carboxylase subunit [Terriglobia bacterium]|nr:acetyl-CoA carboxylase biotin carboxylase subunit [Terriglobia bacterium]